MLKASLTFIAILVATMIAAQSQSISGKALLGEAICEAKTACGCSPARDQLWAALHEQVWLTGVQLPAPQDVSGPNKEWCGAKLKLWTADHADQFIIVTVVDAFADPLYSQNDLLLSPEAFERLRIIDQSDQNTRLLDALHWSTAPTEQQTTVGQACDLNFGMQRQFKTELPSPMEQIGCVTIASTAVCDLTQGQAPNEQDNGITCVPYNTGQHCGLNVVKQARGCPVPTDTNAESLCQSPPTAARAEAADCSTVPFDLQKECECWIQCKTGFKKDDSANCVAVDAN